MIRPQQTTSARYAAGNSGGFLPPSPPAEKATARQDQAGQPSTDDGAGYWIYQLHLDAYFKIIRREKIAPVVTRAPRIITCESEEVDGVISRIDITAVIIRAKNGIDKNRT